MSTHNANQQIKQAKEEERDLSKEREDRCVPIAQEVVKIIGQHKLELADGVNDKDRLACYVPIHEQILEMFIKRGLPYIEISYVFRLVLAGYQSVNDIMAESMMRNRELADSKLWGKSDKTITLTDIDDVVLGKVHHEAPRGFTEMEAQQKIKEATPDKEPESKPTPEPVVPEGVKDLL